MNRIHSEKQTRYVVITPARDEAKYITETIQSVVRQTITPVQWVIVDDGSTDETGNIINTYAAEYSWITAIHRPNSGPRNTTTGAIAAFMEGYRALRAF